MFYLYITWTSYQELSEHRKIEDEKKVKVDNIKKQMRQKWVLKSLENTNENHEVNETQVNELCGTIISTYFPMEITGTII